MTKLSSAARAAINAGHELVNALLNDLTPLDREKLLMFMLAGAPSALTIRWVDGRVELRVGLTPDDSPPLTVLALDFNKTSTEANHAAH
jgi:hypothetical protein